MKITALVGSDRKNGHTYSACENLLEKLEGFGNVTTEIIRLSRMELKVCRGCKLCCDRGEELCPLGDDRDRIISIMEESDGIIFATPNYSFHVSGHMKVFLDRLGFIFHRPRFFGKTCTAIVTQGVFGGGKILEYLRFIGHAMGFNAVRGICLRTLEPIPEKIAIKNAKQIDKLSKRFYSQLQKRELPRPSLMDLMMFRMSRTNIERGLDETFRDFTCYREKGWFTSSFFYETKLNPLKKLAGVIFDRLAASSGPR